MSATLLCVISSYASHRHGYQTGEQFGLSQRQLYFASSTRKIHRPGCPYYPTLSELENAKCCGGLPQKDVGK